MVVGGFGVGMSVSACMRVAGIPLATTAVILMLGRIADVLGVLLSGPLADFCKRRMAAYIAIGLTTLLCYPFVLAVLSKRIVLVMALQTPLASSESACCTGLPPFWPPRASRQSSDTLARAFPTLSPAFWVE